METPTTVEELVCSKFSVKFQLHVPLEFSDGWVDRGDVSVDWLDRSEEAEHRENTEE